ncbi:MAG TPA: amidohydrolase [Candidatus Aphodoplasma excrementigallinarum]|uniref:Amidohydrolase n=1 Tax=Candidatus Aphodoplasma excrementigallinarum TaxID=2840673 RepID=A0A9D1T0G5_9FIRM|nr:amidohydrolase [Candidatus Aphodoplasma excrementigallinarum]
MGKRVFLAKNIITMVQETEPEAILCVDGRIAAVGKRKDILSHAGQRTEVIDFRDATILPGFIDPHSHICACANRLALADLSPAKSFDELIALLRQYKEQHSIPAGKWMIGFGYDNNFLKERKHPDCHVLDKASKENPILITHVSGHMGALNSLAMQEAGVSGNGYLEESEFMQVSAHVPAPSEEEMQKLMQLAQQEYLKYGITTAQEGIAREKEVELLKRTRLKLDVVGYVDLKQAKSAFDHCGAYKKQYKNHLRFGGYKIFLDGSPQGRTAWLSKPYEGESEYAGYGTYADEEVTQFFETALREQVQILAHCNGDAACEQFIRCLRAAREHTGLAVTNRPVMIHAQLVTRPQLAALKELGGIASFFNAHTYYWGGVHEKNLGRRAQTISPLHTAQEIGVCYTLHQDAPVIKPDMLFSVWCAVTRQTRAGKVLGADERIGVYDALKAITANAAYQYFEEKHKGTIEPGKLCDLAVLDKNPLTARTEQLRDIRVLATVKEGEILCQNKA